MDLSGETHSNDTDLAGRARLGDENAWELLMRAYQEPVFRFAYLLSGDPDDAEDIAQETFIRAYRALERFDLARPLRPWLLSICANLAHNKRRAVGRYLAALQRLLQAEPVAAASIEEKSSRRWQAQSLWHAVQKLSKNDQQVIYLRYFLEMSTEEVAQSMDIAQGTVKSRLHRALERLRAVVERDFPDLREAGWQGFEPEPQPVIKTRDPAERDR